MSRQILACFLDCPPWRKYVHRIVKRVSPANAHLVIVHGKTPFHRAFWGYLMLEPLIALRLSHEPNIFTHGRSRSVSFLRIPLFIQEKKLSRN